LTAVGRARVFLVIAVVVVAILAGAYFYSVRSPSSTTSSVQPTTLAVEEDNQPDSMDPAVTYITPGWEVLNQVYQALVAPDGTSSTRYVGVLARSWAMSPDGLSYTFFLRKNVIFSNGDPFNAYVMWFSLYRTLVMNQAPAWILGQNLAASNGAAFNVTGNILISIDYSNPPQKDLSIMEFANQSVQVVNAYEIVLHLGYGYNGFAPYSAFLATLETPMAMAVDPKVVNANGGVVADEPNNWMETNAVGTSSYKLQSWIQGQSVTLVKNPTYWGNSVSEADLNYAIRPQVIDTVNIYYKPLDTMIADLRSGFAQIIEAPVTQYNTVKQIPGIDASILPIVFGSALNPFFLYMDPYAFAPFQNRLVREAVSNAIDYTSIINSVYGGKAERWIGPVPPGFPFYNESTQGLQPYQYDPAKAAKLLSQAGYVSTLPDGTQLNKGGLKFPSVNFLYNLDSSTEAQVAENKSSELHAVCNDVVL
jgi:peptide/nickel transport system substrate-binding protein